VILVRTPLRESIGAGGSNSAELVTMNQLLDENMELCSPGLWYDKDKNMCSSPRTRRECAAEPELIHRAIDVWSGQSAFAGSPMTRATSAACNARTGRRCNIDMAEDDCDDDWRADFLVNSNGITSDGSPDCASGCTLLFGLRSVGTKLAAGCGNHLESTRDPKSYGNLCGKYLSTIELGRKNCLGACAEFTRGWDFWYGGNEFAPV
jgi:hypothetical protein